MNILSFAGSLRGDSYNKKLLCLALKHVKESGNQPTLLDLKEYPFPLYDQDVEDACGLPESVKKMHERIVASDMLIIATPEYNGSIPGVLKNWIDWLSRVEPVAITGKPLLLLAASPSFLGGVRGLWHTRIPFEVLGVHVYPTMFMVSKADSAFDKDGQLINKEKAKELERLIHAFINYSSRRAL